MPSGASFRAKEIKVFVAGWIRVSTAPGSASAARLRSNVFTKPRDLDLQFVNPGLQPPSGILM